MSAKDEKPQKPEEQPAGLEQPHGGLKKVGDIHPLQASEMAFPMDEDPPDTPPWEKADFKRKVLGAGFPGSPGSDSGFLAALWKFTGGNVEWTKKEDSPSAVAFAGKPGGEHAKDPHANPEHVAKEKK